MSCMCWLITAFQTSASCRSTAPFGPPGGAGGVDDQQRRGEIDVRVAAIAAARCRAGRRTSGAKSRPTMRTSGSACRQRLDDRRKTLLHHQHLHRRIRQDEHLLGHGEPPVERHQHRAKPRAGVEQHQIVRMIEREDRDAVAARHAELRFQRARRLRDAFGERRIGERRAAEADRGFVRREGGVAVDQVGKVHDDLREPVIHPSRPPRTASRGRGGRGRFPRSTAASASRSGCRGRCAPAATT